MTTRPIVVGADGSEQSLQAVEWAARAAERRKAPLRVVSVVSLPPRALWPRVLPDTVAPTARAASGQLLSAAAARVGKVAPAVLVDADLLWGPPALALVACASGASMLVVGSRGAGGFATMVLGSVSRYVATEAPAPVVVVRKETTAVHRQIAIGIRDLDTSAAALTFAFEEAVLRQAGLLAVHAWSEHAHRHAVGTSRPAIGPDQIAEKAAAELHGMLAAWRDKHLGVEVTEEVVHGHPGDVLADLSGRTDLVVLGRRGRRDSLSPGIGAVTHAVLNHAHGPVACVPDFS